MRAPISESIDADPGLDHTTRPARKDLAMHLLSNAVTPPRALVLAALLLAPDADAAITGTTGAFQQIAPPAAAVLGALPANPDAFCWNEQSGVALSGLLVNTVGPGTFSGPNGPFALSGVFDSHFIHVDPTANFGTPAGTISFSTNILAVIYEGALLDLTDGTLGAFGTLYPTGDPLRSHSVVLNPSQFTVTGNTIALNLWAYGSAIYPNRTVQMRVITDAVPAPGAAALAVLAGAAGMGRRRRR